MNENGDLAGVVESPTPLAAPTLLSLSSASSSAAASATSMDTISSRCSSGINTSSTISTTISSANTGQVLNFKEILQLFNCAISQEQAWAVLYQVLIEFKHLLYNNIPSEAAYYYEVIRLNQELIDINLLNFTKDGNILFGFKNLPTNAIEINNNIKNFMENSSNDDQDKHALETKVLKSIAYLIFDALDYGNNYLNEPVLQTSLSHLLLLISGHYKEYSNNKALTEDDEGYEQEEEDSISIDKAIEICNNNVAEPEYHYQAVCRGLYAQAYELKAFLAKIEDSKNVLQNSGKDTAHYCFEVLDKTDWAKLWMQVIHELRHGIKLRKVIQKPELRRHIEFELTPFEILLDQIRARRYHLKKVSMDNSLGPEIKKDARDIILEFIRSRPPLKKPSNRVPSSKLNKTNDQLSLHEQLMLSIRNYSTPLRKIDLNSKNISCSETTNNDSDTKETTKAKRVLKADKKLLNHLTLSDDDDSDIDYDELKNLPILQEDLIAQDDSVFVKNPNSLNEILFNIPSESYYYNNTTIGRKRRIKAPESLKSPLAPWREPVENWRALVTEDVLIDTNSKVENIRSNTGSIFGPNIGTNSGVNRRHTMNLADLQAISSNLSSLNIFSGFTKSKENKNAQMDANKNQSEQIKVSDNWKVAKSRLTTPIYFKSGPGYDDFGFVSTQELIKKLSNAGGAECLKLTFDELCHIRNVLTKAELDYLLFDNQLFQDVSKGKVCFSCRKTKFHLFNWGCKCRICQQRICKKCMRNAQLKNGQIAQVPLYKLFPSKLRTNSKSDDGSNSLTSRNSNGSMSNSSHSNTTNEDDCQSIDQISSGSSSDPQNLYIELKNSNKKPKKNPSIDTNEDLYIGKRLLEICVDCYQMMNGVTVSANESQLLDPPLQHNPNSSKNLFIKSINNNKNKLQKLDLTNIDSSPMSCRSPDLVTMQSLSNIKSINGIEMNICSPVFNKVITSSHHSTPTPSNTPMLLNLNTTENKEHNELSTIIITNENNNLESNSNNIHNNSTIDFDSSCNNNQNISESLSTSLSMHSKSSINNNNNNIQNKMRQNLTLDLQPVYKKVTP